MGNFKYHKEYIKRDGRRLAGGGPRDLQRKVQDSGSKDEVISELTKEVHALRKQLSEKPASGFTGEQVDDKINKVLDQTISELEAKHAKNTEELIDKLKFMDEENLRLEKENSNLKIENQAIKEELKVKNRLMERFADVSRDREEQSNKLTTLLTEATEKIERLVIDGKVSEDFTKSDRPQMEDVYIDPADEDYEDVESYIKSKDISITEKEKQADKVNKLKDLLGSLPGK